MMFRPGRRRQQWHFILLSLRSAMVWSTLVLLLLLTSSSIVIATGHGRRRSPFILNSKRLTPLSTTTRTTPSSSLSSCNKNLIFNIRGGRDEINDEYSDEEDVYDDDDYDNVEEDAGDEEQTVIHLETVAEDISKKVVYWTTNISKITYSHFQKWSIWYYESCKRAIKAGIDEFHLQLEKELSDDEEDNNEDDDDNDGDAISKLVVLCQIIPIRTYNIFKRMTISFWTKDDSNEYDSDDNICDEDDDELTYEDDDDRSKKIVADSSQFFSRISKSFNNKLRNVDDDEEDDDYDDEDEDEEYVSDVEDVLEPEIKTELRYADTSSGDLRDNNAPLERNDAQEVEGEKCGNEEKGKSLGVLKEVPTDKLKEIPTTATKDRKSKIIKTVLSHIVVAIVSIVAWEQTRDSFLGSSSGNKKKNRWDEEL